ncbi:ArsR/SmtB family transcription factor [Caldimonas manganoxidans]|uniref:ArsR/SmtB family transcription factor n=1 Tax=Caldimonas manganoxidans TaxID=196015 RepID=UPI00036EDDCB|nr:metalloregulator ArsR/SmtB family transcription factor [Caldimonas manganoxidans]
MSETRTDLAQHDAQLVFEQAAELFGLLAAPMRLRIISELCEGERNVLQLLERTGATQANMSQHLAMLYRAGVLTRRRDGSQVYYRLGDRRLAGLCRTLCTDVAAGLHASVPRDP